MMYLQSFFMFSRSHRRVSLLVSSHSAARVRRHKSFPIGTWKQAKKLHILAMKATTDPQHTLDRRECSLQATKRLDQTGTPLLTHISRRVQAISRIDTTFSALKS